MIFFAHLLKEDVPSLRLLLPFGGCYQRIEIRCYNTEPMLTHLGLLFMIKLLPKHKTNPTINQVTDANASRVLAHSQHFCLRTKHILQW